MGVIAHAGSSRSGPEWAEPEAFAAVLDAHPRLKLCWPTSAVGAGSRPAGWRPPTRVYVSTCARSLPGAGRRAHRLGAMGRMIKEIGAEGDVRH